MRIIVTIGDCNGIGLEAFIKSLYFNIDYFIKRKNVSFTIAGNSQTIKEYIRLLNLDAQIRNKQLLIKDISCEIEEIENYSSVEFGKVNNLSGLLSARSIEYAVEATLKGEYDAILTLPVLKKALYLAGWQYPGHTEMLAKKCNVNEPLMILFKDDFRVALATIHIPLMKVPENITTSKIINVTQIFHNSLVQDFGIKNPRIAILGLNPHAGEEGSIGIE
jgi:4-hydroxythreonine-4-phosphate dehydrogenase